MNKCVHFSNISNNIPINQQEDSDEILESIIKQKAEIICDYVKWKKKTVLKKLQKDRFPIPSSRQSKHLKALVIDVSSENSHSRKSTEDSIDLPNKATTNHIQENKEQQFVKINYDLTCKKINSITSNPNDDLTYIHPTKDNFRYEYISQKCKNFQDDIAKCISPEDNDEFSFYTSKFLLIIEKTLSSLECRNLNMIISSILLIVCTKLKIKKKLFVRTMNTIRWNKSLFNIFNVKNSRHYDLCKKIFYNDILQKK